METIFSTTQFIVGLGVTYTAILGWLYSVSNTATTAKKESEQNKEDTEKLHQKQDARHDKLVNKLNKLEISVAKIEGSINTVNQKLDLQMDYQKKILDSCNIMGKYSNEQN